MPEKIIPQCSTCGATLIERTTNNGRTIYACPNWQPNGKGCPGMIYDPNREEDHKKIYPRVVIRWNVPSRSEKGKNRTVEIYESGDIRCNCIANSMGRECRHINETITYFSNLIKKIDAKRITRIPKKESIGEIK